MYLDSEGFVSCIMPTRNRRHFVGQAIAYFLRQDYERRELVVVDDGEDAVEDLMPDDERVRYVRLSKRHSLGAKRNIACAHSRGSLIAHWDDDDWMAGDRLTMQVAALDEANADICGAHDLLYYRIDAGTAWRYRSPEGWLSPCTLLFRRRLWEETPYPDVERHESASLLRKGGTLCGLDNPTFYVGLLHRTNTLPRNLQDRLWERRPFEELDQRIIADRDFYAALRGGSAAQAPIQSQIMAITLGAHFSVSTGYGSMAEYLALGLTRAGAAVNVLPFSIDTNGLSEEFTRLLRQSKARTGDVAIYFSWPRPELERLAGVPNLFINTMWESSRLPVGWAKPLNRARALIVPTTFVARVCRESGVTVPIEVIPEGIDPDLYTYQPRPEHPGITTLIVAPVDERKNTRIGIAAWKQAFANDPNARLIIKTQYNYHNYIPDDSRITYIDRSEPSRGILEYYREADVLLALGNEGFGLPLVEGMATGLPVIALASEGQADVCQSAPECVLSVEPQSWTPFNKAGFGSCGVRAVPAVEDVAGRLSWVAEHRDEARALGRAASEWAREQRSIWAKGPAVLSAIEHHSKPTRAFRRAPTFWIPSWRTPCGVAEYTATLMRHLPTVRALPEISDWHSTRLLHIQHEHSLYNEEALSRQVNLARRHRVPLVITEHTIRERPALWEDSANALVALTEEGTERLRARHPQKRVEHIPIGCPQWFPPRKQQRGKVIGAFGFLERHKGFWALLDVIRALPDTELVLYSHARDPKLAREFDTAAVGLPVRRIDTYLSEEAIARQLASEADILAFWYDPMPFAAASAAVRLGLASGVPVLTSPIRWFADLREMTYQPITLISGVQRLLADTSLRRNLTTAARQYCHEHRWSQIAERHLALWRTLERP
jgi:glycosyltransferase involved in cell wall biosynthesis